MTKNIQDLWTEIETIKNNHLEHIKMDIDNLTKNVDRIESKVDKIVDKTDNKLDKMDARLWWVLSLMVTTVVGGIVAKIVGWI